MSEEFSEKDGKRYDEWNNAKSRQKVEDLCMYVRYSITTYLLLYNAHDRKNGEGRGKSRSLYRGNIL